MPHIWLKRLEYTKNNAKVLLYSQAEDFDWVSNVGNDLLNFSKNGKVSLIGKPYKNKLHGFVVPGFKFYIANEFLPKLISV